MAKDRVPDPQVSLLRGPGGDASSKIEDCLGELFCTLKEAISQILDRSRDFELQHREALAKGMALSKREAANLMRMSISALDRAVSRGEIEAKYSGRRPRFLLTEIIRYQAALPNLPPRRRRKHER
jgi:hypothetical protein